MIDWVERKLICTATMCFELVFGSVPSNLLPPYPVCSGLTSSIIAL